ncbi:hypothetical protein Tco_0978791 [Tanacetum coccineum]|uniref:Uncharacterized protein n=1 Tax=Tanacetum coccineum TaxID=301880 RepID=A0ABQ5EP97_9ASTR
MAISSSSSSSSSENKVVKERHELKLKIEKWEGLSKNLTKILNSQMSAHDKNGLGFGTQKYDLSNKSKTVSENSLTVFEVRSSDDESTIANDRLTISNEYHFVPPPITGNPLTPRADISFIGLDEDEVIIEDWTLDDEEDVCAVKTVSSVKPNVTQTVRSQADKSVLTRAGLVNTIRSNVSTARSISIVRHVYTVRPVSTARPLASKIAQSNSVIRSTHPRLDIVRPKASNTPIKRSYFTQPVYRPKDLKPDVKTFGVKNMTIVGSRALVSRGMEAKDELPGSCGNPEIFLQDHAVVDSAFGSDPKEVSLVRESMKEKSTDFVTPTKALREAQEEEISPTILEAAKTLSKVASQGVGKEKSTDKGKRYRRRARYMAKKIDTRLDAEEEINTGKEEINTGIEEVSIGSTKVDSGTASKIGQREGKAPMVEEDI